MLNTVRPGDSDSLTPPPPAVFVVRVRGVDTVVTLKNGFFVVERKLGGPVISAWELLEVILGVTEQDPAIAAAYRYELSHTAPVLSA